MMERVHYTSRNRRFAAWLLAGLLVQNSAHAVTQGPTEDSLWYYEIGGAEPVSVPANPAVVSMTLGGSAQLGLGYSCGKFDPVAAVTNTLNDIGAGGGYFVFPLAEAVGPAGKVYAVEVEEGGGFGLVSQVLTP